jgi:hypothetical protein
MIPDVRDSGPAMTGIASGGGTSRAIGGV